MKVQIIRPYKEKTHIVRRKTENGGYLKLCGHVVFRQVLIEVEFKDISKDEDLCKSCKRSFIKRHGLQDLKDQAKSLTEKRSVYGIGE